MGHITKDQIYDSVDPGDFQAMIEVERYGNRSDAFDKIISATHDHFWDPLDAAYVDYSQPFDLAKEYLANPKTVMELNTSIADTMSEKQKIKLTNMSMHFSLSSILHGEQGALSLSASLCHILKDPGAQEYVANQTREEARHVTAFARYIKARWGTPTPVGPTLGGLLEELVGTPYAWKKIVGMQMLIEGLAMGAFANIYNNTNDPILKRMIQFVMTDEAFHHKFGKIWADRTLPHATQEERETIEDWAAECFKALLFNLGAPAQKKEIYDAVGLKLEDVQAAMMEAMTTERIRKRMQDSTMIFRVLIKTLLKAGIITDRTREVYAVYVDMDELKGEGDQMVGDDIAEAGIDLLRHINGQSLAAAK